MRGITGIFEAFSKSGALVQKYFRSEKVGF